MFSLPSIFRHSPGLVALAFCKMSRYIKSSHLRHDTFHSVVVYNLALLSLTWYGLVGLRLCQHPSNRVGLFQTGPSFLWRAFVHLVIRSVDHTTKKRSSRFIKNLFLGNISLRDVDLLRHPQKIVNPELSGIRAPHYVGCVPWLQRISHPFGCMNNKTSLL